MYAGIVEEKKMNNSISEQSLYVESEDDEEQQFDKQEDGSDSDLSNYSNDNDHQSPQRKQSSLNPSWPQSYRQSMDLYSSVPSPSLNFLGTPSLPRFGSSFLTRRHTPEILPSLQKPLLPEAADDQVPHQRKSSHTLLPPIPSRKSSRLGHDRKPSKVSHEAPIPRQSSNIQAIVNGMNVLCGVGILSTPYAVKEGGWVGLSILFVFAVLSFYTGLLLRSCLDSQPGLETYPDIGQAAFGNFGRFAISIILYVELYACCVEYIILERDNLSSLFPNAHVNLGGFVLDSPLLFAILTTLAVLPTVWLRDMSILSYISVGGVIASILVVVCLFWTGIVDEVGIQAKGTALNLSTLPVAVGLYGYCYSGHAVFPNIYTSMQNRNQFSKVLFTSFAICTVLYAGVAVMGYTMFGESTQSQFTLNMPKDLIASKIAVWTTVVNPFTKYALTISPVAMSLEELMPSNHHKSHIYPILIRTALVISTLLVALSIPFFGLVMSLIGSLLTMLVTLILPCACYLSILRGNVTRSQASLCILIIVVGIVSSSFGTYSALSEIVANLSS